MYNHFVMKSFFFTCTCGMKRIIDNRHDWFEKSRDNIQKEGRSIAASLNMILLIPHVRAEEAFSYDFITKWL